MTREEAIELLEDLYGMVEDNHGRDYDEAFRMAIEALSADAVPQSEQYKKGFEDAKRAFEIEYARESENMRKRNAQLEVMLNAYRAISVEAEWIPCSERLPIISKVLVTAWNKRTRSVIVDIAHYNGKVYGWENSGIWKVIAWMPLPEPYEGVTE